MLLYGLTFCPSQILSLVLTLSLKSRTFNLLGALFLLWFYRMHEAANPLSDVCVLLFLWFTIINVVPQKEQETVPTID